MTARTRTCISAAAISFVVIVTAWIWLTPDDASAHALLVQSDPPINARLQDPPTFVKGTFSESLDDRLSSLQVLDGTGDNVDSGETTFGPEPAVMQIDIPDELSPGFYTVIWETLSSVDGHVIKGSYPFTVLNPDGSEPSGPVFSAATGFSGGTPRFDNVIGKWLSITGAVLIVGSVAFSLWVVKPASKESNDEWRRRAQEAGRRRLNWIAWPAVGLLILAGAVELLAQVRQLGGFEFVDDVLRNTWGERWIQRQLVLVAIASSLGIAVWLRGAGRQSLSEAALWVSLAGGVGYLLLISMVGHGAAVQGSFWAVGADFAHLIASAVWIGMLAQLTLFLVWSRTAPDDDRAVLQAAHLQRFSVFAATSAIILLASGIASAFTHISLLESLYNTSYGRALLAKLALVMVLLAVAGTNAFFLRPQVIDEESRSKTLQKRLSIMVRAEIALAIGVLVIAAVLIQYPTPRFEVAAQENVETAAQAVVGYESVQTANDVVVNLTITPSSVGTNSFQIIIFPESGGEVGEVLQVKLRFTPPDPDLGPSEIVADVVDPVIRQYKAVGAFFTERGDWEVDVDLRRREVDDVRAVFGVPVAGSTFETGSRFDFPLSAGSWATVAGVGAMLAALLMAIWVGQATRRPALAPRLLRVGSAAALVIGVAVVAVSLLPEDAETTGNPIDPTSTSIGIGRGLFEANCIQCHGVDGRGDGPLADTLPVAPADFRRHIPIHADEFFFTVMTNGLGDVMPAFGDQLTEDERWHLLNFLKSEFGLEAQQEETTRSIGSGESR
jgi:copper transport protein